MAFGQAAGPPASGKDVARLAELLEEAGFSSFKEARHPMGFTQRQAGGKFTRTEVEELIARLEAEAEAAISDEGGAADGTNVADGTRVGTGRRATAPSSAPTAAGTAAAAARAERRRREQHLAVAGATDDVLAAELELRGWTCIPPTP